MSSRAIIEQIVEQVKPIEGVIAIVLGGSRARGTHTPASDIDLGIYYHPDRPLDWRTLDGVASALDDNRRAGLVTPIHGWGPWINGGGWLTVQSHPVDFLYRDLQKVTTVVDHCLEGKIEVAYQPGHPLGFVSSIYLAEVAVCQPLWDAEGVIADLKKKVDPYPDALQRAIIDQFGWEINFSLEVAQKCVERADVVYAAGCCFRSVMCMLQVLFALNREYWLNEKGALALADRFTLKPARLRSRVERAFRSLEAQPASIQRAIDLLAKLSTDLEGLISER